MKERTVRARNFLGAFLGGILGILSFGFIHPFALPFGCFLGVVAGWWHQEIWAEISRKFKQGVGYWTKVNEKAKRLMSIKLVRPKEKEILKPLALKIFKAIALPYTFPRACVKRVRSWMSIHSEEKPLLISALANIAVFLIAVQGITYLESLTKAMWKNIFGASIFTFVHFSFMAAVMYAIYKSKKEVISSEDFLEKWSGFNFSGSLRYFFKEIKGMFFKIMFFAVFFLLVAACYAITGLVVLAAIVLFCVLFGAVKGFYQAAAKSGHWLCFGVTLLVTAFSAWMMLPWMNGELRIWIIALAAGLLSAVATEIVSRLAIRALEMKPKVRQFISEPLNAHVMAVGETYIQISVNLVKKTYGFLPARVRN